MSKCLLGERVRYDAKIKQYPDLIKFISQHFDVKTVCPEVEIGLSVPRPAVQLYGTLDDIEVRGRDDPSIDITANINKYCHQYPPELNAIHGYIFKSKSPSCGIRDIPLFNHQGQITNSTMGVFAQAILQHYPNLPITDEQGLLNPADCEHFLHQVKLYQQKQIC
ncbi:MAG: DUF523 domain-containing protein [Gammaproteobacteria bacterium]|nr:DUF523 domain-containing protein [Gammaproteobacteria bacterium]